MRNQSGARGHPHTGFIQKVESNKSRTQITRMDDVENGQEFLLLATACDYGQIKLIVAFFQKATFINRINQ